MARPKGDGITVVESREASGVCKVEGRFECIHFKGCLFKALKGEICFNRVWV